MPRYTLLTCLLLLLLVLPRLLAQPEIVGPDGGANPAMPDVMKMTDVDAVIALLAEPNALIRKKAALRLGQLKDPRAIPHLFNIMAGGNPAENQDAVDALGMIGDPRAMPRLLNLLPQSEGIMRVHVADAVIALASSKSLNDLLNALKGAQPDIRRTLIRALGRINDPKAQQVVLAALEDADAGIRVQACWALCDVPTDAALDGLLRAARDPQQDVRLAAVRVLGAQGRNPEAPRAVVTRATPVLVDVLRDPAGQLRQAAAEALQEVRDSRAVTPLLATLTDADGEVLHAAREALFGLGKDTRDPLIAALSDKSAVVRAEAARLLWRLNDPQAIPALITAASDPELPVRQAAVEGLAWMRSRDAPLLPIFLAAAKDPDPRLRVAAAQGVGKLGDAKGIEAFLALLNDADSGVRVAAIQSANGFTDPRVATMLVEHLGKQVTQYEVMGGANEISFVTVNPEPYYLGRALVQIGSPAVEPVIGLLTHPRREARIAGILVLRQMGALKAKSIVDPLIALYKETGSPNDRAIILTTLGAIGDPRALLVMDEARRSEDVSLRATAYTAIGALHHMLSLDVLTEGLNDQQLSVRRAVVVALGEYGSKASPALVQVMKANQDQSFTEDIIKALGATRDPAIIPVLTDYIMNSTNDWMSGKAAEALGGVGPEAVVPMLEAFRQAQAKRPNAWLKGYLYQGLARGGAAVVPKIIDAYEKYEDLLSRQRPTAFEFMGTVACLGLIEGLKHPSAKTRAMAAYELYAVGDERAVEPLTAALGDPDPMVRSSAAWSLGILGARGATDTLITLLGDPDINVRCSATRALAGTHAPQALEPLLALRADPRIEVREAAAQSLSNYTVPRVVEVLCDTVRGRDSVAYYAIRGLESQRDLRAVEPLLAIISNDNPNLSGNGLSALAKIGDPRALPTMLAFCNNGNQWARQSALFGAVALGGGKGIVDEQLKLLQNGDGNIRSLAARLLGASGDPRGLEALAKLAAGTGDDTWQAAAGLAECRDPHAVEPLLKLLSTVNNFYHLEYIARGLQHFATPQVREALFAKLQQQPLAASKLGAALAYLGENRAVPILVQGLRTRGDANIGIMHTDIADALTILRDPRAIPELIDTLEDTYPRARAAAARALEATTGERFGQDPAAWKAWWAKQH